MLTAENLLEMNNSSIEVSQSRNFLQRNQWLLLRRLSQFSLLGLFLAGPLFGYWWMKGNLASSIFLDKIVFSDPYIFLQSIVSGHDVGEVAIIGAATIFFFYLIVGGRVYCSWVCPINVITDLAYWLRNKLNINWSWQPKRITRNWIMIMVLIVSAISGSIAWELVNPITMLQRGLVFGLGMAWTVVLAVFFFDFIVSRRGWCSHICPVGAFYGLIGKFSLVRVSAYNRQACTDCGDCFRVCPEPHVITPALYEEKGNGSSLILNGDCTNCGRCIDVCDDKVFHFATRFGH